MEWQFQINWSAIVEEAKQRRKTQRLTQVRLAELAGVSTPTISRFESGETDILLTTVLNILGVLGMADKRMLIFPEENAYYRDDRVFFEGKDGNKVVQCVITYEVLKFYFNGERKKELKAFEEHRERIEQLARRKYLSGQIEANGSILIKTTDVPFL